MWNFKRKDKQFSSLVLKWIKILRYIGSNIRTNVIHRQGRNYTIDR